jgi:hypothetical protein
MIEFFAMILGVSAIIGLLVAYSAMSWGYVLYKFWGWFLLPVFPNLPHINFLLAIGLMMFIDLFKNHSNLVIKKEYREVNTEMIGHAIAPWIILLVGFAVYWCISPV